jgi:V-type H+-transporting ATPase subunit d
MFVFDLYHVTIVIRDFNAFLICVQMAFEMQPIERTRRLPRVGDSTTFNIDDGYLDALLRGYRAGILTAGDYQNLTQVSNNGDVASYHTPNEIERSPFPSHVFPRTQCETLDDMRIHLASTDYGDFLANEPGPLHTTTIADKCTAKLVREFLHIRSQASQPLATFLDYIT